MKPMIGSPGIGWQHLAKRTSRSPTPLTRTPPVRSSRCGGATVGSVLCDVVDDAEAHDHGLRADRAVADRRVEVVERVVVVAARDLGDLVRPDGRDRGPRQAAQLALERLTPVDDVLVAILALEPLPDLLAGVAGLDDLHPVARRAVLALGRHDLDDVAVLEPVVERHEAVVDLGPDRAVADVGVDPVGEVERRRAGRQVLDVALRGEHEDLVLEDVELDALDELGRVRHVALPVEQLAQPGQLGVVLAVGLGAFLVAPVGGDPDLAIPGASPGSGSGSRAACRRAR